MSTQDLTEHKPVISGESIIVTGSSGFIGSHMCDRLTDPNVHASRVHGFDRKPARNDSDFVSSQGELCRTDDLRPLADIGAKHLVHLAAESKVLFPFSDISQFIESNLSGTLNALEVLRPDLLIFSSSSAVYGDRGSAAVSVDWSNVNPVGIYGMTKAMGELVCAEWARTTGSVAVAFRFGNVIGPRCHGFIPYLVEHATRYPDGGVAAQCRGGGKIVRDYLPIQYVVSVLVRVFDLPWKRGHLQAFNIGTGRGVTNRAVADIVTAVLKENGLKLQINWDNPSPEAESNSVVLDTSETEECFGIAIPGSDEIIAVIEETTRDFLAMV